MSQGYLLKETCEYESKVEKQREDSIGKISKQCLSQTTGFQQLIVAHEEIPLRRIDIILMNLRQVFI